MKPITLVIPAHKESSRIEKTVRHLFSSIFPNNIAHLLFVVDCCNETKKALERASRGKAKILFFDKNLEKGRAIWEGFMASNTEYVGFLDADDSISLQDIEKMCKRIVEEKKDCIIASRTKIHGRSMLRWLSSRAFNMLVRFLFPLPFPDTQCGFKIFKKSLLGSNPPLIEGYVFDVELLLRIMRNGGKIETYPLESIERKGGKFSLLSAPSMLLALIRLRLSS